MRRTTIFETLQQLIKVYAYAEHQYINASSEAHSPILRVFFEQRALERMNFIEEVEIELAGNYAPKTIEGLMAWHNQIYGSALLDNTLVADVGLFVADEKALEICSYLTELALPDTLYELIRRHTIKMESGILSMTCLRALYH